MEPLISSMISQGNGRCQCFTATLPRVASAKLSRRGGIVDIERRRILRRKETLREILEMPIKCKLNACNEVFLPTIQ